MARVIYSELAQRDIKEIVAFIAKDSPDNAERMRAAIEERAALIATMPIWGGIVPSSGPTSSLSWSPSTIFSATRKDQTVSR